MTVKLEWITPEADKRIGYMARVSNPNAGPDDPVDRLIKYLIDHKHWSPFEMVNACVEINTSRDIARQILRHRSFHFQELSQRYAEVDDVRFILRNVRLQDTKNRQNSIEVDDPSLQKEWAYAQEGVRDHALSVYREFLDKGVAKEVARVVLPEGLTPTRMYMNGTIRDWLHYVAIRTDKSTQYEHRCVALGVQRALEEHCPITFEAARQAGLIGVVENA